jgi:hypothetical protein
MAGFTTSPQNAPSACRGRQTTIFSVTLAEALFAKAMEKIPDKVQVVA